MGTVDTVNGNITIDLPTIQGGPIADDDADPTNNPLPLPLDGMRLDAGPDADRLRPSA